MFMVMPDGTVALYAEDPPRFIASRKDMSSLSGAYAAMSDDLFFVSNHLLNRSLVPVGRLNGDYGIPAGITSVDGFGTRISAASPTASGTVDRFGLSRFQTAAPTSTVEAPLVPPPSRPIAQIGEAILPFTRSLAMLSGDAGMVSLSPSGVMAIPSNFDAPVPVPDIRSGIRRCE
jgi:hypothetical protein